MARRQQPAEDRGAGPGRRPGGLEFLVEGEGRLTLSGGGQSVGALQPRIQHLALNFGARRAAQFLQRLDARLVAEPPDPLDGRG